MTRPGDRVLVGVSGGPDSVALLHVLWVLSEELEILLHVGHLNHMLRGEAADEDAAYVRDLAGRLGLPVTIESRDVAAVARKERISVELAARKVRYEFYRQAASSTGAARVALGHHAGDQAETVLLRLVRGTGTTGLAGIPPVRPLEIGGNGYDGEGDDEPSGPVGPIVIRPFIEVTRQEIEDYCRENDLRPRVDASNLTSVYARNRVRRELIPLLERHYNPRVVESIARTAELVREDDAFISCEVRRRMKLIVRSRSSGSVSLSIERLLAEPPAVQRRVIREAVALVGRGAEDIEFEHVEMLLELARSGSLEASASLPRGIRARKVRRALELGTGHEERRKTRAPGAPRELVLEIGTELEPGPGADGVPGVPGTRGPAAPGPFERRLDVPGATFVPELGVTVEAEVFEMGGQGDAYGACARADACEAYFDLDALGMDLVVRTRREGDRISPFGMDGHKKLKELFIDEKVPRNMRDRVPVIVAGREILWVVGVRRSNLARVSPSTRRVLRLVVRPNRPK